VNSGAFAKQEGEKMKKLAKRVGLVLAAVLLFWGASFSEAAENKQVFKFASMFPETHLRAQAWKAFCNKVEKSTDGQVVFKIGYSESLVKAMQEYEAVRMGAIDISGSPSVYISGYFPVGLFADIPGFADSYDHAMEIYKQAMPIIDEEFAKVGLKLLWMHPATLFNMCCNSKVGFIKSIDDFKGVKGRIAGGLTSEAFRIWGGAPVTLPAAEEYMALKLGTTDCTYIGTDSYSSYKLWEVAPYVTRLRHPFYFHPIKMNMKAWRKISAENQKKILQAGREMMEELPLTFVKDQEALYETMSKNGSKYAEPSPELKKAMREGLKPLWDKYLERAGEPGKKIYKIIFPN
jgi:TRAP-type transport system periplasmic protein